MVNSSIVKKHLPCWLVALAILLTLIPQPVHACSCPGVGPPAEELAKSTAVFAGKAINRRSPFSLVQRSDNPLYVTFEVSQVWKGPNWQTLLIRTVEDGASCGYNFQKGEEYLVYAHGDEGDLRVSLCSRTQPLDKATEDLSAFGEGVIPIEENPVLHSQPLSPLSPLLAGGNLSPANCMLPLALVGIFGVLPIRMMRRGERRP